MPFNQLDVDRRTGVILTRLCRFVRELEESSADDDFAERVAAATRASEAAEALSHHVTRHGDEAEPQAADVPSGDACLARRAVRYGRRNGSAPRSSVWPREAGIRALAALSFSARVTGAGVARLRLD